MSRFLLKCCLLTPILFVAAQQPTPDREPLQVGKNLPGAFSAFNINGARAGKFHCLITERNYEPGILIFVRNFDAPDALNAVRPLLTLIDDRIDKNYTRIRLNCYVVFFTDNLPDVTGTSGTPEANAKNDDQREKFTKDLTDLANADPKLKYVIVALDHKDDLKNYALDDGKFITVVMFNKLKIVAVDSATKNELTEKKIAEINDMITEKLGATRK